MLKTPFSIDSEPWHRGDVRARFFYPCRDCGTLFCSLSEAKLVRFKREHSWGCGLSRAAEALTVRASA